MNENDVRRIVAARANEISDQMAKTVGSMMERDGERIAILENEIKHLRDGQDRQTQALKDIQGELHKINSTMSEARGGWRVILIIGGISGTIGAALTKLLPFLVGVPR